MKKSNNTNIKRIAQEAGVSTATVSNVINGNYHKVSKETVDRVKQIINDYNYSPNGAARSLVSNKSKIIALLIPNMMLEGGFGEDPYASQMVSLLEQTIQQAGYYMMVRCVNRCIEITQLVQTWNADGIILLGAYPEEVEEICTKLSDIPVVFTDTYAPDYPIANVGIDDYKGGYLSAKYLLEKGHRNIAFVGPDENVSAVINQRCRGFRDALKEYNLTLDSKDIFIASTSIEDGVKIGKKIIDSNAKYTAIAAMSDTLALGIYKSLQDRHINIADDISIIGFDNIKACNYTKPTLTTISQDLSKKASLVGKHLFEMIKTNKSYAVNEILDVEVIERNSVKDLNN